MKKIGVIDSDLLFGGTRHPNLALMKISGYYKTQNNIVELLEDYHSIDKYDKVFISKVFNYTEIPIDINNYKNIEIGGTGFFADGGDSLPNTIEHHMPDYHLYDSYVEKKIQQGAKRSKYADYLDYSIGFTTRGCFRKCEFCVNKKYDKVFKHSPVSEFLDVNRKRIYLWDDNFMAFGGWRDILDDIEQTGKYFQFRQGLDIRLMTDEKARRLSEMKYYGDFIFAFDHIKDMDLIVEKLGVWNKYRRKNTKLYVLCGFDSIDHVDIKNTFERIRILMEHECLPYIMRFENYELSKWRGMYINLARWCNQPNFFKKLSFREFCYKNGEGSSTMRYMLEFEKEHPEIANEYFDIKF